MNIVEDAINDRLNQLTRHIDDQNDLIVALSNRCGYLEQELKDMDCWTAHENHCPPTPIPGPPCQIIDLTVKSKDEEPEVILVEDDDEELVGGPIEVEVRVQIETPPQELLEALRVTLIRDKEYVEVNREVDLLVRTGQGLPKYEDPPPH